MPVFRNDKAPAGFKEIVCDNALNSIGQRVKRTYWMMFCPQGRFESFMQRVTSIAYFKGEKQVKGPRVLIVGAGRSGLEIAEKLGKEGVDVVATKRTDPIGSMMEMITKKLTLMRIGQMPNVTLMPHTSVKSLDTAKAVVEKDGETVELEPFDTVILASGMLSAPGPDADIQKAVPVIEVIGDAKNVMDIYTAVQAGYEVALKY